MPIYEYECANRHRFELRQEFHAEPRASCPTCNGASRRVILLVPVHYKGSGFYTTDYGRGKAPKEESGDGSAKGETKDGTKASTKDTTGDGAKSETRDGAKASAKDTAGDGAKSGS